MNHIITGTTIVKAEANFGILASKITAAQVKEDCPKQILDLGDQAAAQLSEAYAHKEKYEQHLEEAKQLLAQVRDLCDNDGFAAFRDIFHEKFCPNVGRSRAYELLAIVTGKKSLEDTKASARERARRHRAKQNRVRDIADSSPSYPALPHATKPAPTDANPSEEAEHCKEQNAALFVEDPPEAVQFNRGANAGNPEASAPDDSTAIVPTAEPTTLTPSISTKPTPVENIGESPEDREIARELILEEYFALASGNNILARIRAAKRNDTVLTDLLDALTVETTLASMSPEFGAALKARVPVAKNSKSGTAKPSSLSSLAFSDATPAQRQHFVEAIGLGDWLEAMPSEWIGMLEGRLDRQRARISPPKKSDHLQLDHGALARGLGLAGQPGNQFPTVNVQPAGVDAAGKPIYAPLHAEPVAAVTQEAGSAKDELETQS
jgi:hypothetical protein